MSTLHTELMRDPKTGALVHDADNGHIEVMFSYCRTEGCERKLVEWTTNMKDMEGNPTPRPTEARMTQCAEHGFAALLGR